MIATITLIGVAFGVVGAVSAGVGDFLGGVASRRSTVWGVVAVAWLAQVPLLAVLVFLIEGGLDTAAIGPGALAGVAGAVGGIFLYAGIARGDVAIVASTSGVLASVTAALYDAVIGVALPTAAWVGIALAVPAIALVAGGAGEVRKVSLRALGAGLGAGGSFGLFYVLIGATGGENGDPSVVLVLAATAALVLLVGAPLRPGPVFPRGPALGLALVSGVLIALHMVALLLAVEHGSVATGTVLVSQYPAFTMLLAAIVWKQRPTRRQIAGLGLALISVGSIAAAAAEPVAPPAAVAGVSEQPLTTAPEAAVAPTPEVTASPTSDPAISVPNTEVREASTTSPTGSVSRSADTTETAPTTGTTQATATMATIATVVGESEPAPPATSAAPVISVLRVLPHDPDAFVQGLVFHAGLFYESTGLYGRSTVRMVDPAGGEVASSVSLGDEYFGEGLEIVGDRVIQLTWREETAFVWDAATLAPLGTYSYEGEGWGLCALEDRLVMSNGSSRLAFRDLATFEEIGGVDVLLEGEPVERLNELECVGDLVYANVWMTDDIMVIGADSGQVVARIDASSLREELSSTQGVDVLNGIAYDPARGVFYLTGKLWPDMFEVRIEMAPR